jgi:hypothetical protein
MSGSLRAYQFPCEPFFAGSASGPLNQAIWGASAAPEACGRVAPFIGVSIFVRYRAGFELSVRLIRLRGMPLWVLRCVDRSVKVVNVF